jgi:putative PIN family toxin of toxin-antitoxin system
MIRVVLDTNILISAQLSRQGPPAQIFLMTIIDPNLQLCVSGHIFEEYEEVMRRRRFNRSETEIGATLGAIRAKCPLGKTSAEVKCLLRPGRR